MTWFAWRRQRATLLTIFAVVVLFAGFVVVLRAQTAAMITGRTLTFGWYENVFEPVNGLLFAVPLLAGAFVGAPLFAREREQRTHVLALTQSVSRNRWLATTLAFAAVPVVTGTVVAQALYLWWANGLRPFEPRGFTTDSRVFLDATGPVLVCAALFAVVLGAAVGLLVGNTMSAVAITFGVVAGLSMADRTFLRKLVGHHYELGGGRWETVWPSAWFEAGTLLLATLATIAVMVWWLRSRLVVT